MSSGTALYLLLQDSALRGFSDSMAAALMICLPFALLWWIIAAVALGRERYEAYALLTISAPAAVMVLSPIGAFADGAAGAAYGLAAGYVVGGSICAAWALLLARLPESAVGGDEGLPRGHLDRGALLGQRPLPDRQPASRPLHPQRLLDHRGDRDLLGLGVDHLRRASSSPSPSPRSCCRAPRPCAGSTPTSRP